LYNLKDNRDFKVCELLLPHHSIPIVLPLSVFNDGFKQLINDIDVALT